MSHLPRIRFLLWSRPMFRTCEIVFNHAARVLERGRSLETRKAELEELNHKRRKYQRVLNRIGNSHDHVCAECKGKCCGSVRERDAFTDRVLQFPETSHRAARRKSGEMVPHTLTGGCRAAEGAEPVPGFCPELTTKGCRIPYELRPIQCTAYFCNAAINELSPHECEIGSKALIGLMKVQIKTAGLALSGEGKK